MKSVRQAPVPSLWANTPSPINTSFFVAALAWDSARLAPFQAAAITRFDHVHMRCQDNVGGEALGCSCSKGSRNGSGIHGPSRSPSWADPPGLRASE